MDNYQPKQNTSEPVQIQSLLGTEFNKDLIWHHYHTVFLCDRIKVTPAMSNGSLQLSASTDFWPCTAYI